MYIKCETFLDVNITVWSSLLAMSYRYDLQGCKGINSIPGCKMQNELWASGSWWGGDWNSGGNLWLASRDPSHQTVLGLCQNPQKKMK